jgi:hypothetical protein
MLHKVERRMDPYPTIRCREFERWQLVTFSDEKIKRQKDRNAGYHFN